MIQKTTLGRATMAQAENDADEAALRMAFALSQRLTETGTQASRVLSVRYERLDRDRHAIIVQTKATEKN